MSNTPLVSILLPCYNHENFVQESIQSLIDQSYRNIELIIINDGSKDNTHNKVEELIPACEERFVRTVYINRENRGLLATLREGLELCQGEYISTTASDDTFLPTKIERLMAEFNTLDSSYAVVCGDAYFINNDSEKVYIEDESHLSTEQKTGSYDRFLAYYSRGHKGFNPETDFGSYASLLESNYVPSQAAMIRTDVLRGIDPYKDDISIQDLDQWLSIARDHNMKYVDEPLACYRLHGDNSIHYMKVNLQVDTIKLLLREFAVCKEKGLYELWKVTLFRLVWKLKKHLLKQDPELWNECRAKIGWLSFIKLAILKKTKML